MLETTETQIGRTPRINSHVQRLNRFLPFSAAHDQIYEEYQDDDSLSLETVALAYAVAAIGSGARCIVLTGDAGHGKTHLCRRLIETVLGYESREARALLRTNCDGSVAIPASGGSLGPLLRIHKDFSELGHDQAAELLEAAAARDEETLVVCANEGRLRAITGSPAAGAMCRKIAQQFRDSFSNGLSSAEGQIHIINLNYQSVAKSLPDGTKSLLRRTLHTWVANGTRWGERSCGSCSLEQHCPIRHNRRLLVEDSGASPHRIDRLESLCQAVERLGQVITIREMLMLVAYLVTGGMTCESVHARCLGPNRISGWPSSWAYYNLLFDAPPDLPEDQLYKGISIMSVLRRLDPGRLASRAVDQRVLNEGDVFLEGQLDLQFSLQVDGKWTVVDGAGGIDGFLGSAQSRADLAKEVEMIAGPVRALRRRAFFDEGDVNGTLMQHLGFRHGDAFLSLLQGRLQNQRLIVLKGELIAGLHAIQGLRLSRMDPMLYLVDPAFGRSDSDAAIIARRIPSSGIQVLRAGEAWPTDAEWRIESSVDWIDRSIVIRVTDVIGSHSDIQLDLLGFECVVRAGNGHVPEDFYAHEIRRIRSFLGRLATRPGAGYGEIALFMNGTFHSVSIDTGMIQVGVR
jgi:hypothetical protein